MVLMLIQQQVTLTSNLKQLSPKNGLQVSLETDSKPSLKQTGPVIQEHLQFRKQMPDMFQVNWLIQLQEQLPDYSQKG
ncbi:MAG: hypothetical protein QM783_20945 [Phycisphaerales bacterium]